VTDSGVALEPVNANATAVCDGGGMVLAALSLIQGAEDVARLAAALLSAALLCAQPDTELTVEAVNGRAGLTLRRAGRAIAVVAIQTANSKVIVLWLVLNPAKLGGWHRR
jgi:RNA polymerase sigma-70 factor (ECF subfamily)